MSGAAIETGHGMMPAYVATPRRSGPHPGVVVIHDAMGMGQDVRNQADWQAPPASSPSRCSTFSMNSWVLILVAKVLLHSPISGASGLCGQL